MRPLLALAFAGALLASGCTYDPDHAATPAAQDAPTEAPAAATEPVPTGGFGETIYVPVYSHIYFHDDRRAINLAATLSIRNTDFEAPIAVTTVRYYDSEGRLVRSYLNEPRRLGPLATMDVVVEVDDTSGGSGANFIVVWEAAADVTAPVVEAVMISTASSQGISFTSPGRVLRARE